MTAKKIFLFILLTVLILFLLVTILARVSAHTAKLLIYEGMTYGTIQTVLGSEGKRLDLGIIVYEWDFPDGSVLTVWLKSPTPGRSAPANDYCAAKVAVTKGLLSGY